MNWKITGILLLVAGCVAIVLALGFSESLREDQGMIASAQERANVAEHGTPGPAGHWEGVQESSDQERYDDTVILKAEHLIGLGIVLLVAGGLALAYAKFRVPPASKNR